MKTDGVWVIVWAQLDIQAREAGWVRARTRAARSDVKAGPQRYRAHAARASRAPGG